MNFTALCKQIIDAQFDSGVASYDMVNALRQMGGVTVFCSYEIRPSERHTYVECKSILNHGYRAVPLAPPPLSPNFLRTIRFWL